MKKIVFFTGFVGGRGSSKAIKWLYDGLKEKGYQPIIVSESLYLYKLTDVGLSADYVVERSTTDNDEAIYLKTQRVLDRISFDCMIAFSPRTYGAYYAYKKAIPYVISEYAIPSLFETFPSRYIGDVYKNAAANLLLCQFPLDLDRMSNPQQLNNIYVVANPYSQKRLAYARKVRKIKKNKAREMLFKDYPELKTEYDLFINLTMNDEYLSPFNVAPNNRSFIDAWENQQNGYLSIQAQEQCIGFVSRLIAGLETNYNGRTLIYLLNKIHYLMQPILDQCKQVVAFSRPAPFINLDKDLLLKKAADINICRESLGDNTSELYLIGKPLVTTVVPKGFMNEDEGLEQIKRQGTCLAIDYDDPNYITKLISFWKNDSLQKKIQRKQIAITDAFITPYDYYDRLFEKLGL